MITLEELAELGKNLLLTYGPKLLLAIITLIVGLRLIKWVVKLATRGLSHKKVDASLRHFLEALIRISLKVLLFVSVISMLGVATTSFVAIIGAAGLAIGLALQGSLANFAGGVLILFFKPFKVGDYIESNGYAGTVKKIMIFNTVLNTIDNATIILPNGVVSNNPLKNYSAEKLRRVDITFGIAYEDDFFKAQKILRKIIDKHAKILKDPEPFVRLSELGDSSVNIATRNWVKKEDYWDVYFDLMETVKKEFDKNKISIPYPQMDVHVKKR